MAEQKPIISIDHVSMRFNLSKEKHESLKEYFVALLHWTMYRLILCPVISTASSA